MEPVPGRPGIYSCRLPDGYHVADYQELVIAVNQRGFAASSAVTNRVEVIGAGEVEITFQTLEIFNHDWNAPRFQGFDLDAVTSTMYIPHPKSFPLCSRHNNQKPAKYQRYYPFSPVTESDYYPVCPDFEAEWRIESYFEGCTPYQSGCDSSPWDGGMHPSAHNYTNIIWCLTTATVGAKVNLADWGGFTRNDLVLMKPIMYQLPVSEVEIENSIVGYHEPYFFKATIKEITDTREDIGEGWYNNNYDHWNHDHTVTVKVQYVVFERDPSKPWVELVSPSDGSGLFGGQSLDITWEATSVVQDVRLELWRTSDTAAPSFHFMGLITESTTNDGIFTWTVPNRGDDYYAYWKHPPQYRYNVRISDASNDGTVYDFSDDWFLIDRDSNQPWILTMPDYTFAQDSDSNNRPDQLFFPWHSICDTDDNPWNCTIISDINLRLEVTHDTDPSQSFDVSRQMSYRPNDTFDLDEGILEDPAFTYRFKIEDANNPQVYDVYGPFKIEDSGPAPGGQGTVWWPVFQ